MKKISFDDDLLDNREKLKAWLNKNGVKDVFLLTDRPTGPEEDRAGRRTPILLAKSTVGEKNTYLVQCKSKTKGKEDSFLVWMADDDILAGRTAPEKGEGFIVIDKSKLGRNKRETSEEERQEILERRKLGQTINRIAEEMKISNRRVSNVVREEKGDRAE